MLKELLMPEIVELIKAKNWRTLKDMLIDWPEPDIADLLETLDYSEMAIVFRLLHKELAADVFSELEADRQLELIEQLNNDQLKSIIAELSPDDRTELFEDVPGKITQQLLQLLSPNDRNETLQLLGFPEDSVGRMMTPDYVSIQSNWTIDRALFHIRRNGRDAETINIVYITDDKGTLIDDIPLRRLILGDPQASVETIMDRNFVAINAHEDQERAARMIQHYNVTALPVIDQDGILLGIVTVDDIIDVIEEEVTEDVHKGASVLPLELSYEATSIWDLYRRRITWLSLLALAGFLSSSVISAFEHTLSAILALAFFIPVLIDSGGNTGSQSAMLIIRALAVGELTAKKWFVVMRKELAIGLMLGVTLGLVMFLWGNFWHGGREIGLVVGTAMVAIIFFANLMGGLLPLVLIKLKLDPAVVSSPLITTVIDATGLIIYFSIARAILTL
ncbi:magnesium transporter [candidate division KSB1 bacterium]|nr:magnesium transporter [candidate division KSB1 bacterium]